MKVIGTISWEVQPGFPKLTNTDGSLELQVNYLLNEKELEELPAIRENFIDPRFPAFHGMWLRLSRMTVTPKPGYKIWLLELTYTTPGDSSGDNPDVKETIEYETEEYEEPLKACENYRTNWDHVLLRNSSCKDAVPRSLWESAVTTVLADSYIGKFQWANPDDAVPDGWQTVCAETMPGVTGRLAGAVIVTVTKKASSKVRLEREAGKDYTRQNPPDTFNRPGEWLRCGSSIRQEGSKWVLTVKYRNAKRINKELYK